MKSVSPGQLSRKLIEFLPDPVGSGVEDAVVLATVSGLLGADVVAAARRKFSFVLSEEGKSARPRKKERGEGKGEDKY